MARESEPADDAVAVDYAEAKDEVVAGEARWPMAGAVLAAIVLTILLPADLRLGPRWLLPVIEGALLVALVVGDPGTISRRSRELRAISIALVVVPRSGRSGRPAG